MQRNGGGRRRYRKIKREDKNRKEEKPTRRQKCKYIGPTFINEFLPFQNPIYHCPTQGVRRRLRSTKLKKRENDNKDGRSVTVDIRVSFYHRTMQHEDFRLSKVRRAARVAASKTSSTPSPVREEHSRYLRALICVAVSFPSLGVTNRSDFFRISSIAPGFSRRSFFNPTRMMGTPGHRSFASSIHYNIG